MGGHWKDSYKLQIRITKQQSDSWRAAADKEGLLYRDWARKHLDAAAQDRTEELMLRAQERWRSAGHPATCGCGWCATHRGAHA